MNACKKIFKELCLEKSRFLGTMPRDDNTLVVEAPKNSAF